MNVAEVCRSRMERFRQPFLESLQLQGCSAATVTTRSQALCTFLGWLAGLGVDDVTKISETTLRDYRRWLTVRNFAPATIQVRIVTVRCFFRHLTATGAVTSNPASDLKSPKLGDRLPRNVFTRSQARRILSIPNISEAKGLRDKALLELFYSTGLRCEEMARLDVNDFDQAGFVRVQGKGSRERVAPVGIAASDAIKSYLYTVRRQWCEQRPRERALWLSAIHPHQPLTKQAIAVTVQRYARAAGIGSLGRTHVWRHTCATHLVASGAGVAYVQQLLGHRSPLTTQRYTRVAPIEIRTMQGRKHPRAGEIPRIQDPASIARWR